jgi:hypothetical protein
MLLLPLFDWFSSALDRWTRRRAAFIVTVEASLLIGQWAVFLATIQGDYETAAVYLPFPLLLLFIALGRAWGKSSLEAT